MALREAAISTKEVAMSRQATYQRARAPESPAESNVDAGIARWIPFVPLSALIILLGTFLIYAEVLR